MILHKGKLFSNGSNVWNSLVPDNVYTLVQINLFDIYKAYFRSLHLSNSFNWSSILLWNTPSVIQTPMIIEHLGRVDSSSVTKMHLTLQSITIRFIIEVKIMSKFQSEDKI